MQTPVPSDLIAKLAQAYPEHASRIVETLETPPSVSLRLNPARTLSARPFAELEDGTIPWLPAELEGYWLSERPIFALDPLWHAGAYYVQDASAMTLATIWEQLDWHTPPRLALDLCAAPGGKSTLLRDLLPKETLLVSNEILPKRCKILVENMVKWCGADQMIITQEEPQRLTALLLGACDLILVDAPCSGEGLMRRDEEARRMWSPQLIADCVTRQRAILQEAMRMLAPEGILLYATCTLNQEENDQMIQWLLDHYPCELIDLSRFAERITGAYATSYGLHLWPGIVRGEGQYLAALRLTDIVETPSEARKAKGLTRTSRQELAGLSWLSEPTSADYFTIGDRIYQLTPEAALLLATAYREHLAVATPGLEIASMRHQAKGYEPSFALLHHKLYDAIKLPSLELPLEEALCYLRGEALTTESSTERGFTTITYRGIPLGLAHSTGTRLNNSYPKPYRLRI